MPLLLGQLVFTNFPAQGFKTLVSPQVPTEVQQAFIRQIAHRYWDSYNPPNPNYRAAYLHQISAEQTLFGWLYNDGWDDLGRGYVPYFICYYLAEPLDAVRLQTICKCLAKGPFSEVDRSSGPPNLATLSVSDLDHYAPTSPGVTIPEQVLAECQAALQSGQLLDFLAAADQPQSIQELPEPPPETVYELLETLETRESLDPSAEAMVQELRQLYGSAAGSNHQEQPSRIWNKLRLQQTLSHVLEPLSKQRQETINTYQPSPPVADSTADISADPTEVPCPASTAPQSPAVKVALLIGVSEYGPGFRSLPAAQYNIVAVEEVLRHPDLGGFTKVKTLLNPDPLAMQEAIEALANHRHPQDLVLLYFCGYIAQDHQGRLHLATRIARRSSEGGLVRSGAVLASFIREILAESQAQQQVVILDGCFTASQQPTLDLEGLEVGTQFGEPQRVILTGTTSSQAYLEQTESGTSAYTHYLVEGLRTGIADLNEDGQIGIAEWHEYAATKVRKAAPAIKPDIFGESIGSQILIAAVPLEDPKFQYRREVEHLAGYGEISAINRSILDMLRERLGLATHEATAIETEVLKPYQEYQQKLQQYTQALAAALHQETPLSEATCNQLKDLQQNLGLTDEVIALVEDQVTRQVKAAGRAKPPTGVGTTVPFFRSTQRTGHQQDLEAAGQPRSFLDLQPPRRRVPWQFGAGAIAALALIGALSLWQGGQSSRQQAAVLTKWQTEQAQTLPGHSSPIWALATAPKGKLLASGSGDQTIKLWDLETGTLRQTLSGHQDTVWSVALSADGQTLASGSGDQTIKLWDLETGTLRQTLSGHQDTVWSVALSPDGQTLASGSGDQTVKLWDLKAGRLLNTFEGHSGPVRSVALSPDGQTLVSGSYDQTLKLWDLRTGELRRTFSGHSGRVISVALSPDGQTLASASEDKTIKLWNLQTGKLEQTLSGHSDWVNSIAFGPDGQTLASASEDKTIKLWNLQTGKLEQTLSGQGSDVYAVTFGPDQQRLIGSVRSGTIKIWRQ